MRLTFFGSGPNPGRALLFAVAALSAAAPGCSGCEEPTDEQAIRALVAEAVAASERNDVGALMDCATDDFKVDPGGADRREVKAALLPAAKAVLPKVATRKAPAKARGPVAAKRKAGAARAH